MTQEKVIWSSPRKGNKRTISEYSAHQSEMTTEEQSAKKMCMVPVSNTNVKPSDLDFSVEVAELMKGRANVELQLTGDTRMNQENFTASAAAAASSSSSDDHLSGSNKRDLTRPTDSLSHHGEKTDGLSDIPLQRKSLEEATTGADSCTLSAVCIVKGANGLNKEATTTSVIYAPPKAISTPTPSHWNYIGVSFRSAAGFPSSSGSADFSTPIPCTPLSPWYLSNGVPNFSKQVQEHGQEQIRAGGRHANILGSTAAPSLCGSDHRSRGGEAETEIHLTSSLTSVSLVNYLNSPSIRTGVCVPLPTAVSVCCDGTSETIQTSSGELFVPLSVAHTSDATSSGNQKTRDGEIHIHKQTAASTSSSASASELPNTSSEGNSRREKKKTRLSAQLSIETERSKKLESRLLDALLPALHPPSSASSSVSPSSRK